MAMGDDRRNGSFAASELVVEIASNVGQLTFQNLQNHHHLSNASLGEPESNLSNSKVDLPGNDPRVWDSVFNRSASSPDSFQRSRLSTCSAGSEDPHSPDLIHSIHTSEDMGIDHSHVAQKSPRELFVEWCHIRGPRRITRIKSHCKSASVGSFPH